MTRDTYYQCIQALAPTNGEMPLTKKQFLVKWMKEHPGVDLTPATDKELLAITNYLNHKSMEFDLLGDKPPYARYKDAVLCLNYEKTEWVLLERRPEDQLWDLWYYTQRVKNDTLPLNLGGIFSLKAC